MNPLADALIRALGAVPGAALGAASGVAAAVRRTKPLHPAGVVGDATLTVAPRTASGVPFLDTAGEHPALVRWSRAMGLPEDRSDIEGLALRIGPDSPAPADLLFASTGEGAFGRHVLVLRSPARHGPMTTLLPLSTDAGSLLLRVSPAGPDGPTPGDPPAAYQLSWSRIGGPWHPAGRIEIRWEGRDEAIRFEPVANLLPGTRQYPFLATLREPAYAAGRLVTGRPRSVR